MMKEKNIRKPNRKKSSDKQTAGSWWSPVEPKQYWHLCGVTSRSTVFCDRLGQTRFISLFRSASLKRCARTPGDVPANMSHQICTRAITTIHIHIRAVRPAARDSGLCSFSLSPDASLISRAVRIRAISVEVKCTVLSSAMGMFIFTNRWEEWKQRGGAMNQEQTTNSSGKAGWARDVTTSQFKGKLLHNLHLRKTPIFTFEKLESVNVWQFCLLNDNFCQAITRLVR